MNNDFLSNTHYTRSVDLKKLTFIHKTICNYAFQKGKKVKNLRILEVACGEGGITVPLGTLGCKVRAFDINEKAVEKLKCKIHINDLYNIFVSVDNACSFDDGLFYDVVVASEVLEHLENPSLLLANISKRMKIGSCLIITTPNGFGPWELRNRLIVNKLIRSNSIRHLLNKEHYIEIPGEKHVQFYSKSKLLKLLSEQSFNLSQFFNSDSFLSLFSDWVSNYSVEKFDIALADRLPFWCANGWYASFIKH